MHAVVVLFLVSHTSVPIDFDRDVRPILDRHCVACHGARDARSDLRLDSPRGILRGGNRGPLITPGESEASLLIRAVTEGIDGVRMPANGPPLSAEEVRILKAWVDQGAQLPDHGGPVAEPRHWAFRPVSRPVPPPTRYRNWCRGPIDAFIARRLEGEGLAPSREAERRTLVRRLWLDVLGLLPDPDLVEAFVRSPRPDAYERMVDRALASPHYGERWGRHWLDLARYADSHGYTIDGPRSIWPYRDWVIRALNENKPFDRFVVEQIAGDLLPNAGREELIATGFHRNTLINQEGGTDPEEFRVKAVVDRVNTTGAVFLGLTIGCARCHEHKYDPISQREYYEFFAFFNSDDEPTLRVPTPEQERALALVEEKLAVAKRALQARERLWGAAADFVGSFPPVCAGLGWAVFARALRTGADILDVLDPDARELRKRLTNLTKQREELLKQIPTTLILRKRARPRETHVMIRGDFLRKGVKVTPGTPEVLPPLRPRGELPDRLDLALWLVSPDNPLTPRVTVNRVWQRYFGIGIVRTENDFGTQGDRPSHPDLLDWLANAFVRSGWDLKRLHRSLVTSATYRQRSDWRQDLARRDPANRLLGRQNRLRVEAEIVRDLALCASGLLTYRLGGPGVYPPQPEGIYRFTQVKKPWPVSTGAARYRRGMYIYFWRSSPYPFLITFDAPRATTTCTRRVRSNTPLQALMLANDVVFLEAARSLAVRALREAGADPHEVIRRMFSICLCRPPDDYELTRLIEFYREQLDGFGRDPESTRALLGPDVSTLIAEPPVMAAWTATARVVLNLDEFITRE